jgi:DNA-binding Lrp family transcriptional regulator
LKENFRQFQEEIVHEIEIRRTKISDLLRRMEARD